MTGELEQLRFASDATFAAIWGAGLLLIAGLAMWADMRRTRRKHPDKVGLMPWTAIFFLTAVPGVGLIALAVKGWGASG
jgi:hypothetical protein